MIQTNVLSTAIQYNYSNMKKNKKINPPQLSNTNFLELVSLETPQSPSWDKSPLPKR